MCLATTLATGYYEIFNHAAAPRRRLRRPHTPGLRDRALIVLMLVTGLRSSEALGITVADLDTIEGHAVVWVTGKGGARERVKVQPRARRLLTTYLATAGITEGAVFRRLRPLGPRHLDARPSAPTPCMGR